jgi:hypothetical protein
VFQIDRKLNAASLAGQDGTTYTDRYRSNYRSAELGGRIGPMTFAPGLSGGTLSSFSSFSKGRTQ